MYRLLGEGGLTLLRTETQHLKFRGKGHEDEDLHKLIGYYTVWANNLYPKYNFKDFAQKVTKPASSARVKETLNVWRNEYIDRRNIRMGISRELSDNNSEGKQGRLIVEFLLILSEIDEGQDKQQRPVRVEEEESSEDDNRPLFFPITTPLPKTKKSKPKKKKPSNQPAPKTSTTIESEDEEEEEPLFSGGTKRRIVAEPEEEQEQEPESRESALARLARLRQERAINQRAGALKRKEEELKQAKAELEKSDDDDMEEYEDAVVELALSDDELEKFNV